MDRLTVRDESGNVSVKPSGHGYNYNAICRLADYEDEAEQREKGCGKCDTTALKTLHPDYKFCPYCGAKIKTQ